MCEGGVGTGGLYEFSPETSQCQVPAPVSVCCDTHSVFNLSELLLPTLGNLNFHNEHTNCSVSKVTIVLFFVIFVTVRCFLLLSILAVVNGLQ